MNTSRVWGFFIRSHRVATYGHFPFPRQEANRRRQPYVHLVEGTMKIKDIVRFWSKVKFEDCWIWIGSCWSNGYGQFMLTEGGKIRSISAHRTAYELVVGSIPDGLQLDHLCKNRRCVNPAHLEPVTSKVNNSRSEGTSTIHSRKTHCPHGHPYSGDNLYIDKDGARRCRACQKSDRVKEYHREWRQHRKEGVLRTFNPSAK